SNGSPSYGERFRSPVHPKGSRSASALPAKTSQGTKRNMGRHVRSVSIVVADDHPVVLHGLVNLLSKNKTFKIIASCTGGPEAVEGIQTLKADRALLDINLI